MRQRFLPLLLYVLLVACSLQDETQIRLIKRTTPDSDSSTITIGENIQREIRSDQELSNYDLDISVTGKKTILRGMVSSEGERQRIEDIARRYSPNKQVINEVTLTPWASDHEIVEKVRSALLAEGVVDVPSISISSQKGIVTVGGLREDHEQIDRILSITLNVPDVKDVRSEFTLIPQR